MELNITHRIAPIIAGLGLTAALLAIPTERITAHAAPASDTAPSVAITIPDPREASLLQLHGYSGAGTALIRIDGQCYSMPVRFVAGDFGGQSVTVDRGGPIGLRIVEPDLVRVLHEGRDLVREGSAEDGDAAAGIIVETGLPTGTGFVINPGSSVLADVFGARPSPARCPAADLAAPGGE